MPLRMIKLKNGEAIDKHMGNGRPSVVWIGGNPASKYYLLVKDEEDNINWLASLASWVIKEIQT